MKQWFQNRTIMFCLPIPILIYWERYIYFQDRSVYFAAAKSVDQSWEYVNRSQTHECRNWDWGRAVPFPGIHKINFRYSVVKIPLFPVGSVWLGELIVESAARVEGGRVPADRHMVRLCATLQQVGHRSGGRWKGGGGPQGFVSHRGGIQKLDFGKRLLSTYQIAIKSQKSEVQ